MSEDGEEGIADLSWKEKLSSSFLENEMNYINTPWSLNNIKGLLETDGHVMGTMIIFPS